MEIPPVPEEESVGDECSSLSSNEAPKESAAVANQVKASPSFSSQMNHWRNLVFGCLILTAVVLAIASYVCFSYWEDSKVLPGISVVVVLVSFCNVAVLFFKYDQQVQQQLQRQIVPDASNEYYRRSSKHKQTQQYSMMESTATGTDNNNCNNSSNDFGLKTVTSLLASPFQYAFRGSNSNNTGHRRTPPSTGRRGSSSLSRSIASHDSAINHFLGAVKRDHTFLSDDNVGMVHPTQPAAEFFTETTVVYMDITGFTAWSSVRDPSQVFTLLETLFHAFDNIAQTRGVFKVETVGDCYVAVTGLPEPNKDHAVTMAYFARDCLQKMDVLCEKLETTLGPDTSDLKLRIGIHSGAVTGGVLRGKRSRFQLFGDTVNTAALMESAGEGGTIHLSEATAKLIEIAGKSAWLIKRATHIVAKGKGVMQTYYLNVDAVDDPMDDTAIDSYRRTRNVRSSVMSVGTGVFNLAEATSKALENKLSSDKMERLISWNVDLLLRLLTQSVARRQILIRNDPNRKKDADESIYMSRENSLLDEVKETIRMPSDFHGKEAIEHAKTIRLDPAVREQLHDYVRTVANMYHNNPFHNFEHASHVTMSVAKLLSRIVAPSANEFTASTEQGRTLDDHTYGITSDPLTQFACILSALMHDADHPGVPNAQLVVEKTAEAEKYKGKSVAEQNSLDKCWDLLMQPKYKKLRETIYTTSKGLERFRSLLINSVLATDICDKDLKNLRNARWDRAFKKDGAPTEPESEKDSRDRKATIVIEHLIQASDVAHTMQHWHVYRQWNERLFRECYKAWKEGRAEKDPAEFWYKGEIGFYDFYIIPLAKKLKECGVFGVSSSEYLDYAMSNRAEWEEKGEEAVQEMVANVKAIEEKVLKKQALAQEKWLTAAYGDNDDSVAGSSGMISFDSRASLGFLGPFEKTDS